MSRNSVFSALLVCSLAWTSINCAPISPDSGRFDVVEQPSLFEGDIAGFFPNAKFPSLNQTNFSVRKNGVLNQDRWPENKLYYEISTLFSSSEADLIQGAIAAINGNATNFQLVPRISEEEYVFITRGEPFSGCWSYIGRVGGQQLLNLEVPQTENDAHCMYHGIIVHELMHAVGFWHEQSRSDRDNHVDINWDNIEEEQKHNFLKYNADEVDLFGSVYDYDSLMHYGRYDFAINTALWTIRPKAPQEDRQIGQRQGLSETDISKLNLMYPPCKEETEETAQGV